MPLRPLKRTAITSFTGEYRWLSNFSPAIVIYEDDAYPSVEHAYQAAKTYKPYRAQFQDCSASEAKRLGKRVLMRDGFSARKLMIMGDLCRQKFEQEPYRTHLLETGDMKLIEGNSWNDTFWGRCNGRGENHLGEIIMKIREELHAAATA